MQTGIHLIKSLKGMVGNTPMLEINFLYKGRERRIYAKAENLNMTGSIKDRMAFHILSQALISGHLEPGMEIFEATSGNTGISFAAIGRALGHKVNIFMPDWMSDERKNIIRSLGANIKLVSKEEGGFLGSIAMANEAAEACGGFLPHQFSNEHNTEAHYKTTGPEIWWQLRFRGIRPDAFVAGVGTGGTVMGVGKFLKEQDPAIKAYPLEPTNSPTLSTGHKVGKHRIQGISDEFIPSICQLKKLDEVIGVDDGDAIIMAQKLSAELGLGVGISSGANFIGAIMAQEMLGEDAVVVTVFADSNKKYLTTDLMREEPVKEGFISPDVKLLNFISFKRVCLTCCDPAMCEEMAAPDISFKLPKCSRR
ncbi:MAG TPA: cysteine synthase family protein [Bacteroidales bacterium]|nr:cysteine synthase family protein [Bacteroidales bacterium]